MEKLFEFIFAVLIGLLLVAVGAIIGAIPLYFLWNWLMPMIFGLTTLTFFEAIGVLFLTGILFKSYTTVKSSD